MEDDKRICSICGAFLSSYNKTNACFAHKKEPRIVFVQGEPLREQRARRLDLSTIAPKRLASKHTAPPASLTSVKDGVTVAHMLEEVCTVCGVTHEELLGSSRKKKIVRARHIAMYLLRIDFSRSFPMIAQDLCRDHTTIIHGCKKMKAMVTEDASFGMLVERIRSHYTK